MIELTEIVVAQVFNRKPTIRSQVTIMHHAVAWRKRSVKNKYCTSSNNYIVK